MSRPRSALGDLLHEALGGYQNDQWADDPGVLDAIEGRNYGRWDDVVSIADQFGQRVAMVDRLRRRVPTAAPGRRFDALTDVMTECEAFAWGCQVAGMLGAWLSPEEYGPDIAVPGWGWIEAKTLHVSDDEKAKWGEMRRRGESFFSGKPVFEPNPTLMKKFHDALAGGLRQWELVGGASKGRLVLFVHLTQLDSALFADKCRIWDDFRVLASVSVAQNGVRVVLTHQYDWRNPVFDIE